jgi:acetyl esterase/lipase
LELQTAELKMEGMIGSTLGHLPLICKAIILHTFRISPTASKWDLRTEITVRILRSLGSGKRKTISDSQANSLKDPGVKGKMWVSKFTIPQPYEDNIKEVLFRAIDEMKDGGGYYTEPQILPVDIEWTGFRAGVTDTEPEPLEQERTKYLELMKEVTSDVTILYFHGGAYYMMDPATHRKAVAKLCEKTGGRAMSVRYRLAPQNPFPAALLDAFIAYLSMLYPPSNSPHTAVYSGNIVFSGDSAGGNLALALLQFILQLHRTVPPGQKPQVNWNGEMVDVPIPAGVAVNSPWCDMTSSFDSIKRNAKYDYLLSKPEPEKTPSCSIWPADPPRATIFTDGSMLIHPLVSPVLAEDWSSAPPMYFNVGEELLLDEAAALACKIAQEGVPVVWEEYEAMPHCFALALEWTAASKQSFESWAKFCVDAVNCNVRTSGTRFAAKTLDKTNVYVTEFVNKMGTDWLHIWAKMKGAQDQAIKDFNEREERRLAVQKLG